MRKAKPTKTVNNVPPWKQDTPDRSISAGTVLTPIAGSRWDDTSERFIVCFVEPTVLYCINSKGWGCLIESQHAEMLEDSGERIKVPKNSFRLFGKVKGWES